MLGSAQGKKCNRNNVGTINSPPDSTDFKLVKVVCVCANVEERTSSIDKGILIAAAQDDYMIP